MNQNIKCTVKTNTDGTTSRVFETDSQKWDKLSANQKDEYLVHLKTKLRKIQ